MPLASAVYEGVVRHRRRGPHPHAFSYRVAQLYLDLDELERVFSGRWLWSVGRRNLAEFRRSDFLGSATVPLAQAVRECAARTLGQAPQGPIRVLAHLRYGGYVFNPVTFYYCYRDAAATALECIVAEITNTPWRERHAYVLTPSNDGAVLRDDFAKQLHVSPFLGMDYRYRASLTVPGATASVHLENWADDDVKFDATLKLHRRELTPASLRQLARHYPLGGVLRVIALIYREGIAIRLSGIRNFPHPTAPSRRIEAGGHR